MSNTSQINILRSNSIFWKFFTYLRFLLLYLGPTVRRYRVLYRGLIFATQADTDYHQYQLEMEEASNVEVFAFVHLIPNDWCLVQEACNLCGRRVLLEALKIKKMLYTFLVMFNFYVIISHQNIGCKHFGHHMVEKKFSDRTYRI